MSDVPAVVTALAPKLTRLDERVLAALDPDRGCRESAVAKALYGRPAYRCEDCDKVTRVGGIAPGARPNWEQRHPLRCPEWADGCGGTERPVLLVIDDDARQVHEVLRGLERVGLASCRGGWWRRV